MPQRISIGFQASAPLALRVTDEQLTKLNDALGSEGWHEVETEVDRYISWPGQALSYKLGQLELLRLRAESRSRHGAAFDIRAFHDEILGAGALPLDILDQRIDGTAARRGTR